MSKHTPGYLTLEIGKVISLSNWRGYGRRELHQDIDKSGYAYVRLTIKGKRKKFMVHKLVALNYLPDRPSQLYEIRHLNGNKQDNRVQNLTWGTRKENADDREKHGKTSRGFNHSIAIKQGLKKRGFNVKF